jgi:hypothetical protein
LGKKRDGDKSWVVRISTCKNTEVFILLFRTQLEIERRVSFVITLNQKEKQTNSGQTVIDS